MADFKKQNNFTRVNNYKSNRKDFTNRKETKAALKDNVAELKERFGDKVVNLALIIKNNAEIRRFTAIGIINYLKQTGAIDGVTNRVSFKWNKFAVISDGLVCEYKYEEVFIINALVASFTNFSASAQRIIDAYCKSEFNEGIQTIVKEDAVTEIALNTEQYIVSKMNTEELVVEPDSNDSN